MDQIPEIVGDALTGAGDPTRNGYAIIIVLSMAIAGVLVYVLLTKGLQILRDHLGRRDARFAQREAEYKTEQKQRLEELKLDYQAQLDTEKAMREDYRTMAGDYNKALGKVTEAFGENSAVLRQAKEEIRRSVEASDRNTAAFQELMAMLPRQRNSLRKTPVEKEPTHNA